MRLYHFTKPELLEIILTTRRLKVASVFDVNDPFELLFAECADADDNKKGKKFARLFTEKYGLVSFCKDWSASLMWGHYSSGHRGVALGFDVPDNLLTKIVYSHDRVPVPTQTTALTKDDLAEQLKFLFNTKSVDWQYEREFRLYPMYSDVVKEDGRSYIPFSSDLVLREIVLGVKCTLSLSSLQGWLGDAANGISIFRTKVAESEFRVVRDETAT